MDLGPGAAFTGSKRPRRAWYAVAALIAAGGLLPAAALPFVAPLGSALGQRITPGQAVTVQVPAAGKVVWSAGDRDTGDPRCEPAQRDTPEPRAWTVTSVREENLTLNADGKRWRGALLITAQPAGGYSVTCTMTGAGSASLAIGDPPWLHGAAAKGLALLGAVLLASVGQVIGGGIAVLVAIRRRRGSRPW